MSHATPTLHSGDVMTRREFHARYRSMSDMKAELIDGVVYVASPLGVPHSVYDPLMITWMTVYAGETPGVRSHSDPTWIIDDKNEPQPDGVLTVREEYGGSIRRGKNFLGGVADLPVEISYTSASYDLHQKKAVFERTGCPEYLVFAIEVGEVHWFVRDEDGAFTTLDADKKGIYRSRLFPGLWLDSRAFFAEDLHGLLATLGRGLRSAEHKAFVQALARRKKKKRS